MFRRKSVSAADCPNPPGGLAADFTHITTHNSLQSSCDVVVLPIADKKMLWMCKTMLLLKCYLTDVDNIQHDTETCTRCRLSRFHSPAVTFTRDVMTSQCMTVKLLLTSKTYPSVCGSCFTLEQMTNKNWASSFSVWEPGSAQRRISFWGRSRGDVIQLHGDGGSECIYFTTQCILMPPV